MTLILYINFISFNKEIGEGTGAIISLRILPLPLKLALQTGIILRSLLFWDVMQHRLVFSY